MSLFHSLFKTYSEKELKKIDEIVDRAIQHAETFHSLSDEQLKRKTEEFQKRAAQGESLDRLLPEAYGTVMEASDRVLHMRPYRVQVQGAVLLHQGRIAELKTGEGKTLIETMPAYLNALEGKGVHVVTVNDYLADRDAKQMGQIYQFLGLSVGIIKHDSSAEERQAAYGCDITYVTNNELGFDYLRDNMATFKGQIVQRGLHYAIIDEIDSILIDEAGTPLIISGKSDDAVDIIKQCDAVARKLAEGEHQRDITGIEKVMGADKEESGDFMIDPEDRNIVLTYEGTKKAEKLLGIKNLADPESLEYMHWILNALKANYIMQKDRDYLIRNDEILIIDEFTGRVLPGRRFTDGLHQAIEAKEGMDIHGETMTYASITFQSFFNKYKKKCGMTGTAMTQVEEFRKIYGLDVVEVPTNRPVKRIDRPDVVYRTEKEKIRRVIYEVENAVAIHQPILIGTVSVEDSEKYSAELDKVGIKHRVLNAKNDQVEAEIIGHAGEADTVTIATNMAGRGSDIKLDSKGRKAGGLKVIGTQRHESRRIDNQLRGRSGRQGDPGESVFIVSLEDDLIQRFAAEKLDSLYSVLGKQENEPIVSKAVSKIIEGAQSKVESVGFARRNKLAEYDEILSGQRDVVYDVRTDILNGNDTSSRVQHMIREQIGQLVYAHKEDHDFNWNKELKDKFQICGVDTSDVEKIPENCAEKYMELQSTDNKEVVAEIERMVMMRAIDLNWVQQLTDMDYLKMEIWTEGYAQNNPVQEYKLEGYDMFKHMEDKIQKDVVRILFGMFAPDGQGTAGDNAT